jgi:hypothetical protein
VIGTVTVLGSGYIKLQVSSTEHADQALLGKNIRVNIPSGTPTYFGGKYANGRTIAVGDAVVAIIVPKSPNYLAHQLDDLGP